MLGLCGTLLDLSLFLHALIIFRYSQILVSSSFDLSALLLCEKLVLEAIQGLKPRAVIVDSIQTVYLPEATGSAGSVIQVLDLVLIAYKEYILSFFKQKSTIFL